MAAVNFAQFDVDEVLSKLSISEKVDLLAGEDFWHTKRFHQYGVPSVRVSDGPNGVRGTKYFNSVPAACFPCGTALASTFNPDLLYEAGKLMGDEAKAKSAHVILGPTINTPRSPLGGRTFESFGEDPVLSGLCAAALVNGIQSTGVQAAVKHFVCNDQEHRRNACHSIVPERSLREIYALPFQLAIRDALPGSVMSAYNGLNGTWCSDSRHLLQEILRGEWGWNGLVMSDWNGTYSTTEATIAGLDLEMPGPPRFRGEILKFNASTGKLGEHVLDKRARTVLEFVKTCAASGVPEHGPEVGLDTPETAALLRKIGGESLVLLKNDDNVLPLKKNKKTLVVGPNAKITTYHGGGSAMLLPYYAVSPFDGIAAKLETPPTYTLGAQSHKCLPLLGHSVYTHDGRPGMMMAVYNEPPSLPSRVSQDEIYLPRTELLLIDYINDRLTSALWYADVEGSFVSDEDCVWELSLIVCGTAKLFVNGDLVVDNETKQRQGDAFFGTSTIEERGRIAVRKGKTYDFKIEFGSSPTSRLVQDNNIPFPGGALRIGGCKVISGHDELARAAALAAEADQVVVCAGLNAEWETEGADRDDLGLPGLLNELISILAAANPRTVVVMQAGAPVEMPWIDQVPAVVQAWYGGNETGNCIADVLFGDVNPSGKLCITFPRRVQDNPAYLNFRSEHGRVLYGESVYVGYRFYERVGRPVLFPFGHGLSYTTFSLSDLRVTFSRDALEVLLTVTNTGHVAGAQVVQVYVAPRGRARVNRPVKELKGFAKVHLRAGQAKRVAVESVGKYAVSYWDEERSKWCAEKGEYDAVVGSSSRTDEGESLRAMFEVEETFWWNGL